MKFLKVAGLTVALLGAAGIGAAVAPAVSGQTRVVAPRPAQVFTLGGGRIGVSVSDLEATDATAKTGGVTIDEVEEGSPAEKAGLRKGDVIVEFDGERVRSVRQFTRLVGETPPGRTVSAAVQRGGQRMNVSITPRESDGMRVLQGDNWRALEELRNFAYTVPRGRVTPAPTPRAETFIWPGGSQLGMTVGDLSPQLAEYFGTKDGVLVSAVRDDSVAAKTGVKAGDVITSVNGATIENASELRRRIQRIEAGEEFTLGIVRDKKTMTLKGKIEPRKPTRWTSRSVV